MTDKLEELREACTLLQQRFVHNLVRGGMTQREAYVQAGGTAEDNASQRACSSRMFADVNVRAFFDALNREAAADAILSREEAMVLLSDHVRVRPADVYDLTLEPTGKFCPETGEDLYTIAHRLKPFSEMSAAAQASIKNIKMTSSGFLQVELYDKHAAAKQLGEMLGWDEAKRIALGGDPNGSPLTTSVLTESEALALLEKHNDAMAS